MMIGIEKPQAIVIERISDSKSRRMPDIRSPQSISLMEFMSVTPGIISMISPIIIIAGLLPKPIFTKKIARKPDTMEQSAV